MAARRAVRPSLRDFARLPRAFAEVAGQGPKKQRLLAQLDPALSHQVVMQPQVDGPPGWVLQTHTPPLFTMGEGESFCHHASMFVDTHGSFMKVICFGPPERVGVPATHEDPARAATQRAIQDFVDQGCEWSYAPLAPAPVGGEPAYEITLRHQRLRFTEWRFVHAGWFFVVGLHVLPAAGQEEALSEARRVLATWQWLEG